ncbi:hypothetical protein CW749_22965 [Vibrio sp. vnigr-6D03]|uniref:hypothetical protein n=1 Tax=Vibrio sp. vnigr-6D03 TaxID=2058088 RepID=UPI000C34E7C1|nr:hypothetical protein [Vibrio sp. vnigr-6D03]PKF77234.1 hypothetical protein CW749_22965 [Vibrio sp. vnigr-6D03]
MANLIGFESNSNLACANFTTLMLVEESNFPALKPTIFENLTTFELSKRYNAQLSSQKRTNAASASYRKHKTHRKLKMPRVFGLIELFVVAIQAENSLGNEALSLHSTNCTLANKIPCNQTTKPKTPIQSRI